MNTTTSLDTSAKSSITERIAALRQLMKREKISAFIFPSSDPHNSEYVAEHWKGREWISGFNGSAGTAVVTMEKAALWTDSRYFIAAAEQLSSTEYVLMKDRLPETPTISEWLCRELMEVKSPEVGIDGNVCCFAEIEQLRKELQKNAGITLRTNFDPLQQIWDDRPVLPEDEIVLHPLEYAGEPTIDKIDRIRKALRAQHADGILVTALDDIAWTLNLRGNDVHCNPVFIAYLLISTTKVKLYINKVKLTAEVAAYLKAANIEIYGYDEIAKGLAAYEEYNILLDANAVNYNLAKAVCCPSIIYGSSPIPALKAIKNSTEIEGFRRAMIKDGIALVKFLKWLKPAVAAEKETEISVGQKLTDLRSEQPLFKGVSFDSIVGYAAHGAIVHYEATPETNARIIPQGLLLIDSGAQYQDGTTDITRTIALGETTAEERRIYTLVLKGHIRLDRCKFPRGACGSQIDALAREAMWREGYNFMHGTGHGVGSYLNVHEGPHQIRMEWRPAPLLEGMTVTNEPGIYVENKFGVRIENILLVKPYRTTDFGSFLEFDTLTLAPIDTQPIDLSLMTNEEIEWLNGYHLRVFDVLSPYLGEDEKAWLREATKAIRLQDLNE